MRNFLFVYEIHLYKFASSRQDKLITLSCRNRRFINTQRKQGMGANGENKREVFNESVSRRREQRRKGAND